MIAAARGPGVLVVDDEPPVRRLLKASLYPEGYRVLEAGTLSAALERIRTCKPALVVLSLDLQDLHGPDAVRAIRRLSAIPVIVLSTLDDEDTKVAALDSGADDYVTRPFGTREMQDRIRNALRRRHLEQGEPPLVVSGDLAIDLIRRRILVRDREIRLSRKEYALLSLLAVHAGKVLTHPEILKAVWGAEATNRIAYLRVVIRALRRKIEADPAHPAHILTVPGVGYRLRVVPDAGRRPGGVPRPAGAA